MDCPTKAWSCLSKPTIRNKKIPGLKPNTPWDLAEATSSPLCVWILLPIKWSQRQYVFVRLSGGLKEKIPAKDSERLPAHTNCSVNITGHYSCCFSVVYQGWWRLSLRVHVTDFSNLWCLCWKKSKPLPSGERGRLQSTVVSSRWTRGFVGEQL